MKKSYRSISIIAYTNVAIIFLLEILHNQLMNISEFLLFGILLVYSLVNGWYIQRIIAKQRKYETELSQEKVFSNHILETISSGIVILEENNQIKYLNDSAEKLLGIIDVEGTDILMYFEEDKERVSKVIDNTLSGNTDHHIHLTRYLTESGDKHLILKALPFITEELNHSQIMLYIEDITETVDLTSKLENQYLNMFKSFVKFIDAKDTYTGLHSTNVSEYVSLILDQMKISGELANEITVAANLHDIGKIGIPESVLNKPGKLTNEEYNKMKEHPSIGADLVGEIIGYENISTIIRHHHERYDGGGYPDGLKGTSIPLGSKIIAVADAYDAITTDRIYQQHRSVEEGIRILNNEKGKQFDADIVDFFIEALDIIKVDAS